MGNTAKQCRLGLFQDSDFAGDLEDSKSTMCGTLCVLGSHTFVVFEDNETEIKMIVKGRSPTMRLLLIGSLIESIRTPKSKSNTLTPKTNSQTY